MIANTIHSASTLFRQPLATSKQWLVVLLVAILFVFMPVCPPPNDWVLNTHGLWGSPLTAMYHNPNHVYPPWAIYLLLPLYFLGVAGIRLVSVLVVAWLTHRRQWPLSAFFLTVLSPFFLFTMYLVNMDVLAIILPMLLWELAEGKRSAVLLRGAALLLLAVKPQGTWLVAVYLLWQSRRQPRQLAAAVAVALALMVPISLVGSPALLLQWLGNIQQPSAQNVAAWSRNNVSLTAYASLPLALALLAGIGVTLYGAVRRGWLQLNHDRHYSGWIAAALLLSPYASVQSLVAAGAFVPGLGFLAAQYGLFLLLWGLPGANQVGPLLVLALFVGGVCFDPPWRRLPAIRKAASSH